MASINLQNSLNWTGTVWVTSGEFGGAGRSCAFTVVVRAGVTFDDVTFDLIHGFPLLMGCVGPFTE